jgi:hypothetical protein
MDDTKTFLTWWAGLWTGFPKTPKNPPDPAVERTMWESVAEEARRMKEIRERESPHLASSLAEDLTDQRRRIGRIEDQIARQDDRRVTDLERQVEDLVTRLALVEGKVLPPKVNVKKLANKLKNSQ